MAIDQLMLLYSNTAITGAVNSDIIPLSAARQFGTGARPLYIDGRVTVAFTDTGDNSSAVLIVQSSPYEAFNSAITNTTVLDIATNAAVGARLGPIALPALGANCAFLRLTTSVAGGNFTAGSITAWLTPDPELYTAQPVGWTGPSTS
jgi:hypothetical protein